MHHHYRVQLAEGAVHCEACCRTLGPRLRAIGQAESTPWTSLRPGAHGGISPDFRAECPAISKDFRPAKPSRELEVIVHHTPFAP